MDLWEENKVKKVISIVLGSVCLIALLIFFIIHYFNSSKDPFSSLSTPTFSTTAMTSEPEVSSESFIFVDVKGGVKNPGVYEIFLGARAFEIIQLAGGLVENADEKQINQAQILTDQQILYIPLIGEEIAEEKPIQSMNEVPSEKNSLVNINTADLGELMTLPGIGEKKAAAIMEHRQNQGSFSKIEGIMEVTGIGDATFTNLKELITIK